MELQTSTVIPRWQRSFRNRGWLVWSCVLGPLLFLIVILLLTTWPAAADGPTYVCGPIGTSATWRPIDNPYIVTCDVTVQNNAVLTIEPGVVVSFTKGSGLFIGNLLSPGKLVAGGSSTDLILFTTYTTGVPYRGFWDGIEFAGNSPTNTLRYCVVEYAGTGIFSNDSDDHTIDHCLLRYNGDGGDTSSGGAISIDGDRATIINNRIYDNELGLRLRKSNYNIINNNQIYDNDHYGIAFVVEGGHGGGNNTIAGNQIHDNGDNGLSLDQGVNNELLNNQIYGNGGNGVWARYQTLLELTGNLVCGNGLNGLTYATPNYRPAAIHSNVLCSNVGFDLQNQWATTITAEGNWFGTNSPTSSVEVSGPVDFSPWISMTLTADPDTLPADGTSTADLTLTLRSDGYAVPDGYTVTVTASMGNIAPPVLSLVAGQATATYTAGTVPGSVDIEVQDRCASLHFTETLSLATSLDLAVVKDDSDLIVGPNKDYSIEYTISVSNVGLVTATSVVLTDILPPEATYTGGEWTCATGVCSYPVGTLIPLATAQVSLPLQLDKSALDCPIVLTNTVKVADSLQAGDIDPTDNVFTLTSTFDCLPDLVVVKNDNIGPIPSPDSAWIFDLLNLAPQASDPRPCVFPGEWITYTIAYVNTGLTAATGVVLTETLPAHTSYIGYDWNCVGDVCTRSVGSLSPDVGGVAHFVVQVDTIPPDLRVENEVRIGGAEQDLYPPDNVSYDDTPICESLLMQIRKDDNLPCAFPGDEIRYTIVFTNSTDNDATGVVLTETLPAHTTYLTTPGWLSLGGGKFVYHYGFLPAHSSDSVEFVVQVNDPLPDTVVETVNVVCLGYDGPPLPQNCYTLITPLPLVADLRVVKHDQIGPPPPRSTLQQLDRFYQVLYGQPYSPPATMQQWEPVKPGDVFSYTITYLNLGRRPATGIVLTDTPPAYTTYVGYGWTHVGGRDYVLPVNDLAVGQGKQVNFWVRVGPVPCTEEYLYNWVHIGGDVEECNLDNNWSGEETPVECTGFYSSYLPIIMKEYTPPEGPTPTPSPTPSPTPTPTPKPGVGYVSDVAVNPETNRVYVASPQLDVVFAVNPSGAGSIVATIPVGDHPGGLAVVTTTNKIYAANLNSWTLTAIRGSDHTRITDIYVGAQACKAAADSGDARVYVTNHLESDNGAAAVNSQTDTFVYYYSRLHATQGRYGIDVDPKREKLFIAARDAGLIAIQDAYLPNQDPQIVKLDPPRVPFVVAFNPTTEHLFVTAADNNLVVVLDPYSIQWDKGAWITWHGRRAFVLDQTNAGWIKEIPVGLGAEEGIAVNPLTGYVYVTNADSNTVSIIKDDPDPAKIKWIKDLVVGQHPQGVDVDVKTNLIYVGNAWSRDLTVIKGADNTFLKTIPLY